MRFTLKPRGDFQRQLEERIKRWGASKNVGAKLVIPEALHWVYWQEYGVPAHTITPVEAKMLAFPGEGGTELRDSVDWPGIRAHHTVQNAMEGIKDKTRLLVREAMQEGGASDPEKLKAAFRQSAEMAKEAIAEGLAEDLPGTRPVNEEFPKQSGKLLGETASSVFTELAEVVEVED